MNYEDFHITQNQFDAIRGQFCACNELWDTSQAAAQGEEELVEGIRDEVEE